MWKFIVDVVHDFVSSLQPDVGRGFLHVSNLFLLKCSIGDIYNSEAKLFCRKVFWCVALILDALLSMALWRHIAT